MDVTCSTHLLRFSKNGSLSVGDSCYGHISTNVKLYINTPRNRDFQYEDTLVCLLFSVYSAYLLTTVS